MTERNADRSKNGHPPKPRLAIRVGFAGVREDFNPERPGLREDFSHVLKLIATFARELHKDHPGFDPDAYPQLIFICSLAAGADQFAAKLAIEQGYELQVPLAMHRDDYIEDNFNKYGDDVGRETFLGLLGNQATTKILELDGSINKPNSYDISGTVLVNHCDVLLAIWDFSEGKGSGGTADSVRKARELEIPVVAFQSIDQRVELRARGRNDRRPAELYEVLQELLDDGLENSSSTTGQENNTRTIDAGQQIRHLQAYYREVELRGDLGVPYELLISAILGEWKIRFWLPKYRKEGLKKWKPVPGQSGRSDPAREYFRDFDLWADCLAVYYGQWMRGVVAGSIVLGVVFVTWTLVAILWYPEVPSPYPAGIDAIPYIVALMIIVSKAFGVHRRWLEYRLLSELLRNHALCEPIGGLSVDRHRFHARHGFTKSWVLFYYQAVVRSFGIPAAILDDEYLEGYSLLLRARLQEQADYHWDQLRKCSTLHRRIRTLGLVSFSVTLIGPLPELFVFVARHFFHTSAYESLTREIGRVPYIFAGISAAIAGFAAQENFARLAQVSSSVHARLTKLIAGIKAQEIESDKLRQDAGDAIDITIQEHAGWVLLTSLRDLNPPS